MSEAVFATGPEELFDPETRQSLTGLEVMQGILEGRFPHPPICKVLGFRLSDRIRNLQSARNRALRLVWDAP